MPFSSKSPKPAKSGLKSPARRPRGSSSPSARGRRAASRAALATRRRSSRRGSRVYHRAGEAVAVNEQPGQAASSSGPNISGTRAAASARTKRSPRRAGAVASFERIPLPSTGTQAAPAAAARARRRDECAPSPASSSRRAASHSSLVPIIGCPPVVRAGRSAQRSRSAEWGRLLRPPSARRSGWAEGRSSGSRRRRRLRSACRGRSAR